MAVNFDLHNRLEPWREHQADLQRGFLAEIADPVWFLGRQWQLGEHQGEDAASPVLVRVAYRRQPIGEDPSRPGQFPGRGPDEEKPLTPAETIVEGEPDDWWTLGRRIRLGRAAYERAGPLLDNLPAHERAALGLPPLPPPYDVFAGGYDGLAMFRRRQALQLPPDLFAECPTVARGDHWRAAKFVYETSFALAATPGALRIARHDGGEIDWWSAEATDPLPEAGDDQRFAAVQQPARFNYPGAPAPRWWQIEDARVDIGGFPPDRSHFPTLLLLDLLLEHSNDWFTFHLDAQIGDIVTVDGITVVDIFGDEYSSADPRWTARLSTPATGSLFRLRGWEAAPGALALWPVAATPVTGEALEQVALGVDEDANLLWAVEERADGRILASLENEPAPSPALAPNPDLEAGSAIAYLYQPSTATPHHWHPYVLDVDPEARRRFVQARLVDFTQPPQTPTWLAPAPRARLLADDQRGPGDPFHAVDPGEAPVSGLRLDRRYVLARRTDGSPVLWVQRRRLPLLSPPAHRLRFDVLQEGS